MFATSNACAATTLYQTVGVLSIPRGPPTTTNVAYNTTYSAPYRGGIRQHSYEIGGVISSFSIDTRIWLRYNLDRKGGGAGATNTYAP